jgi:hypothetical protein
VATKIIRLGDVPIRTKPYTALVVGTSDRHTQKELVPMSRTLAALASLVLTGLGLVVLLPDCASACSCGGVAAATERKEFERALSQPGSEVAKQLNYNVNWVLSHPGAVFSGKVVDVEKSSSRDTLRVTLMVFEVWNGPRRETLEVSTPSAGAICGYPFKEGQEYLVYADGKEEPFKVDLCSGTKQLSKADAEIAFLEKRGEGEKPTNGGDALNDTSGVVPARAVVGMAGLAMAASFLVVVRLVRSS